MDFPASITYMEEKISRTKLHSRSKWVRKFFSKRGTMKKIAITAKRAPRNPPTRHFAVIRLNVLTEYSCVLTSISIPWAINSNYYDFAQITGLLQIHKNLLKKDICRSRPKGRSLQRSFGITAKILSSTRLSEANNHSQHDTKDATDQIPHGIASMIWCDFI